jgi:hypothetical protein
MSILIIFILDKNVELELIIRRINLNKLQNSIINYLRPISTIKRFSQNHQPLVAIQLLQKFDQITKITQLQRGN